MAAVISLAILPESVNGLSHTVNAEVIVLVESSRLDPVAVASLTIPLNEAEISAAEKPACPSIVAAPEISVAENLVSTDTCLIDFDIRFICSEVEPVTACKFFKLFSNSIAPDITEAPAAIGKDNAP